MNRNINKDTPTTGRTTKEQESTKRNWTELGGTRRLIGMAKERSVQLGRRMNNNKCPNIPIGMIPMDLKKMVGLRQTDKCMFCKTGTESTSLLLSGCKKLSEQLFTQRTAQQSDSTAQTFQHFSSRKLMETRTKDNH